MRRPCKNCEKMFAPSSKWNLTCEACVIKSRERAKIKNRKTKIDNFKKKYLKGE